MILPVNANATIRDGNLKTRKFILTDLRSLPLDIDAYKQRIGIEERFQYANTGG
ncbi:hypothetical protein [Microcoleus vaginatus]|uniref:hypothetical protein n=1 Tax=Microcoleus vaginatus TaxID=119532 RepID=UPI0040407822